MVVGEDKKDVGATARLGFLTSAGRRHWSQKSDSERPDCGQQLRTALSKAIPAGGDVTFPHDHYPRMGELKTMARAL
jgi:hypothetical protein